MTEEELIKTALSLYKDGDKVDQTVAYNGLGSIHTIQKVSINTIRISHSEYINVSIDNVGVYNSNDDIWAPVINKPKESLLTKIL